MTLLMHAGYGGRSAVFEAVAKEVQPAQVITARGKVHTQLSSRRMRRKVVAYIRRWVDGPHYSLHAGKSGGKCHVLIVSLDL